MTRPLCTYESIARPSQLPWHSMTRRAATFKARKYILTHRGIDSVAGSKQRFRR